MDGVGTSIVGRPRRLSADRRARPTYTLIWEEPAWAGPAIAVGVASPALAASSQPPDMTTTVTVGSTTMLTGTSVPVTYTMTNSGAAPTNGQPLTYTIDIPTTGTLTLGTLPSGWRLTGTTSSSYTLVYTGTVAAGQSAPAIPATYTAGSTVGTVSLTSAVSPGAGGEQVTTNNAAGATITVTCAPCTSANAPTYRLASDFSGTTAPTCARSPSAIPTRATRTARPWAPPRDSAGGR